MSYGHFDSGPNHPAAPAEALWKQEGARFCVVARRPFDFYEAGGRRLAVTQPWHGRKSHVSLVVLMTEKGAVAGKSRHMKHQVDIEVGGRLRQCRWLVGMSLQELAERIGVSYQQIQKYESGQNRISISRLWDIAGVLGVSVMYFLEDLQARTPNVNVVSLTLVPDCDAIELMRVYESIPAEKRRQLLELARSLCDAE